MKPSRMIVYLAAAAVMVPGARLAAAPVEIANAVYSVITAGEYAMCDDGDIALGGGGKAPACTSGAEAICGNREHPVYDGPTAGAAGWRYAIRNSGGTIVTEETYATCLDVSTYPDLDGIVYLQTAEGFAVHEVSCEENDLLVGGGAEPTPCSGCPMALLELDNPKDFVEDTEQGRVYAGGWAYGYDHLGDPYYDNNVNLAVCLSATSLSWWASIYLVQADDTTEAWCEPGDTVLSGGGQGPRCDSGSEPACTSAVQYEYDGPIGDITGREGWAYAIRIQGVGHGTTRAFAMCARADPDGDGVLEIEGDCLPENPDAAPDQPEICDDGVDNNCNGLTDTEDPACPEEAAPEIADEPVDDGFPDAADADAADSAYDWPSFDSWSDGSDLPDAGDGGPPPAGDSDSGCGCRIVGQVPKRGN